MIIDNIRNANRFYGLGPRIQAAFEFLRTHDLVSMETGRLELEGSSLFALIQTYQSKPLSEGFWEAHRRYIDLQYIVSGQERIGFSPVERMVFSSHDEARDLTILTGDGELATLEAGDFMLLWPNDVHMPGLQVNGPEPVRKVVFKIALD